MSRNTLTTRLTSLKTKTAELTVQEVKVPDSSADLMSLFESNSSARSDSANEWTIDVFPNMIPILMYVMLISVQHARATDHRDHAKSSIATICMYHMSIVYGFLLLNDLHVRPAPSAHARSWSQTSWKHEFANFLLSLPVPEFLVPILSQLHASQTDRTKNVFFVPSAAGLSHDIFYGRFVPLNFFAEIHDCTATLPGNSTRFAVLQDLFSRVLYRITAGPAFFCQIPDLIGVTIDQVTSTTANYVNSKFYQVFTSVFNPVLFRDYQRRSSLATLSFRSPTYANHSMNAYDLLFSASSHNLRELKVTLQAVSSILSGHVVCKQNLGTFISSASGINILQHGYSTYPLPTWSSNANVANSLTFASITHLSNQSEEERATDISFLQPHTAAVQTPTDITDAMLTNPLTNVAITATATLSIYRFWPWSLRYDSTPATGLWPISNSDQHLVAFNDSIHTAPRVLILDVTASSTVSAHLTTLCGMVIESFELDGSTIEMPNALKSLGMQNCMFADSAIAYKYVTRATRFYPRAANTILGPLHRAAANPRPRLPASSLLHDRTMIMLPHITPSIADPTSGTTLPGMSERSGAYWLRYVQSFLGFRTVDGSSNTATLDDVPGMTLGRLLLWSPYSYTPFESDDEPLPDLSESRSYFITNLRTIFGTDTNLIEVKHAYEALPVV